MLKNVPGEGGLGGTRSIVSCTTIVSAEIVAVSGTTS